MWGLEKKKKHSASQTNQLLNSHEKQEVERVLRALDDIHILLFALLLLEVRIPLAPITALFSKEISWLFKYNPAKLKSILRI